MMGKKVNIMKTARTASMVGFTLADALETKNVDKELSMLNELINVNNFLKYCQTNNDAGYRFGRTIGKFIESVIDVNDDKPTNTEAVEYTQAEKISRMKAIANRGAALLVRYNSEAKKDGIDFLYFYVDLKNSRSCLQLMEAMQDILMHLGYDYMAMDK